MEAAGSAYPITLTIDAPLEVPRWRVLFSGLLAIPHLLVLYALGAVGGVLAVISWFAIVFTGKHPSGIANVQCMCARYALRAQVYVGFLTAPYPPFSFSTTPEDPGDFAGTRLDYRLQEEGRNRLTTFFRIFMVLPHVVVLAILGIAAFVVYIAAFFAVLITGRWPAGMRAFVVSVFAWGARVQGYYYLLTDEYPPFELS